MEQENGEIQVTQGVKITPRVACDGGLAELCRLRILSLMAKNYND